MSGSRDAPTEWTVGDGSRTAFFATRGSGRGESRASSSLASQGFSAEVTNGWPLRSYLELAAFPSAVPCARLHARQVLWEWGLAARSDDVELLVSELTTNAMQASQSLDQITPIRLWLMSDRRRVTITVWDSNPRPPVQAELPGDAAENGRGLLLVSTLSERWGWYPPQDVGGKCVWCEVEYREG